VVAGKKNHFHRATLLYISERISTRQTLTGSLMQCLAEAITGVCRTWSLSHHISNRIG